MEKSRSNGPVGRWVLVKCPRFQPVVVLGKPRSFATFGGKNLRIRPIGGQAYPILDGAQCADPGPIFMPVSLPAKWPTVQGGYVTPQGGLWYGLYPRSKKGFLATESQARP
jgi:hypothetical protein